MSERQSNAAVVVKFMIKKKTEVGLSVELSDHVGIRSDVWWVKYIHLFTYENC